MQTIKQYCKARGITLAEFGFVSLHAVKMELDSGSFSILGVPNCGRKSEREVLEAIELLQK